MAGSIPTSAGKKNEMTESDNPSVSILLCTKKDQPVVEYALADMDNCLFVSKYQIELPEKEVMERFLKEQIREVGETECAGEDISL